MSAYVQEHIRPVRSIDPNDTDFGDLSSVGTAVGNARIVMLGEQDHGDASAFTAKARLIRYLHEALGFDVLVFESDLWAMDHAWQQGTTEFVIDSIRANTYGIWANCSQNDALFDYIAQSASGTHPLAVAGMDCRHAAPYSKAYYLQELRKAAALLPLFREQPEQEQRFYGIVEMLLKKEFSAKPSAADQAFFFAALQSMETVFPTGDIWKQECRSLAGAAKHAWHFGFRNPARDIQMAENLEWLCTHKYPGRKVIVWGHNYHLAKKLTGQIKDKERAPFASTAGQLIADRYRDSVYSIGFTSHHGTAGALMSGPYDIGQPKGACLENWIDERRIQYGFMSFKGFTTDERFRMKGLNHELVTADWTKVFDGIFYIREMQRCTERK